MRGLTVVLLVLVVATLSGASSAAPRFTTHDAVVPVGLDQLLAVLDGEEAPPSRRKKPSPANLPGLVRTPIAAPDTRPRQAHPSSRACDDAHPRQRHVDHRADIRRRQPRRCVAGHDPDPNAVLV